MGNKVDISEVIEFSSDFQKVSTHIKSSLKEISTNIEQIIGMDTFSGKAAKNAKGYFDSFHKHGIIEALTELFTDLNHNLKDHLEAFHSNVDSHENAIIQSDYLNDQQIKINIDYQKLRDLDDRIQKAIHNVSDITSAGIPSFYTIVQDEKEVVETITELEENFNSFTNEGKSHNSQTKALIEHIEKTMNSVKGSAGVERFSDYKNDENFKKLSSLTSTYLAPSISGYTSSKAIARAAENDGLSVSKYEKNGRITYRINASEAALKELGIKPNKHAKYSLYQSGKSGRAKTPLNYYDKKTGKQVWSPEGKELVRKYPSLELYNYNTKTTEKFKSVGRVIARGAVNSVTDLNPRGIISGTAANGIGKGLGALGIGLNYYNNYNDAKTDGLNDTDAYTRATIDTTIDTATAGAVTAGVTAVASFAIPIPFVGTAIGVAAGIGVNAALNRKFGKNNKSIMDRAKDAFHKLTGWFS
ncbi:T7SS effector LXG polymorphic toxin [Virgibacillus dokdonensis]|uniref:T7SS effector LXG polymorphic toxin n=1 Tax=Virgibacillus dokdonensis TaxID=302167 RepID=A0ABU7VG87_9BACI